MTDSVSDESPQQPLFRSNKRRKIIRRQVQEDDNQDAANDDQNLPQSAPIISNGAADEPPAASVIRPSQSRKARSGISITKLNPAPIDASSESSLVHRNGTESAVERANSRFTKQTGEVKDVMDRHMLHEQRPSVSISDNQQKLEIVGSSTTQPVLESTYSKPSTQPSVTGTGHALTSLEEIPIQSRHQGLPPNHQQRHNNRQGNLQNQPPRKRRDYRTPATKARDDLVESILSESSPAVSSLATSAESSAIAHQQQQRGSNISRDQEFAEQFEREYVANQEERRSGQGSNGPNPASGGGKLGGGKSGAKMGQRSREEELMRGPKLGGSRSARAAMHRSVLEGKGG